MLYGVDEPISQYAGRPAPYECTENVQQSINWKRRQQWAPYIRQLCMSSTAGKRLKVTLNGQSDTIFPISHSLFRILRDPTTKPTITELANSDDRKTSD